MQPALKADHADAPSDAGPPQGGGSGDGDDLNPSAAGVAPVVSHWADGGMLSMGGGAAAVHSSMGDAVGPALKADHGAWDFGASWRAFGGPALSPIGDSVSEGIGAEVHDGAVQRKSAADVASEGFSGVGHEIPYRKEMEQSFGTDFSSVRAHTDGAAHSASEQLGAHAYAMGNQVAFKSATPDKATVAHELTHVIQQTQGSPSCKSDDGSVDTSGEAEADAVEAAVRAGKPAASALESGRTGTGPALKRRGPALDAFTDKFSMGISFDKEKFEKSYGWKLWDRAIPPIPIPPVPGTYVLIEPAVNLKGSFGAHYGGENKGNAFVNVGVEGTIGVSLAGGVPEVALLFGGVEGKVAGGFKLNSQSEPGKGWNLEGTISTSAALKAGVKLGPGGMITKEFVFGEIEIFKLTGIYFDSTGFKKEKLGFEWGKEIKALFDEIKAVYEKVKNAGKWAWDKAKRAGNAIASAPGRLYRWAASWF